MTSNARASTRLLLASALFTLAACSQPADKSAETSAATTADTAPAAEAAPAPAEPATSTTPTAADLAGRFTGTLPCASCPGIDTTLTLNADGRYSLVEVYQGEKDGRFESAGRWTVADRKLELKPDGKDDEARAFSLDGKDALTMLDIEGKKIESTLNYSLRRQ